jgi:hypothetical protein
MKSSEFLAFHTAEIVAESGVEYHAASRKVGENQMLARVLVPSELAQHWQPSRLESDVPRLMPTLLYGSELRLLERCGPPIKDVDLAFIQFTVRHRKGEMDCATMLQGGKPGRVSRAPSAAGAPVAWSCVHFRPSTTSLRDHGDG